MAINRVQFQPGLSMAAFMRQYGTEEKCQAALEAARWPQGFSCPACHGQRHCVLSRQGRKYFQCYRCHHQTSLAAGTIFQSTRLPLTTWFLAMHLLTQSKNNVSALELKRHLGVNYRTAWLIKHMYGLAPFCKIIFHDGGRNRLHTCIRPFNAANMPAGPDEIRAAPPQQALGLL